MSTVSVAVLADVPQVATSLYVLDLSSGMEFPVEMVPNVAPVESADHEANTAVGACAVSVVLGVTVTLTALAGQELEAVSTELVTMMLLYIVVEKAFWFQLTTWGGKLIEKVADATELFWYPLADAAA